jgi:hypothetical protein
MLCMEVGTYYNPALGKVTFCSAVVCLAVMRPETLSLSNRICHLFVSRHQLGLGAPLGKLKCQWSDAASLVWSPIFNFLSISGLVHTSFLLFSRRQWPGCLSSLFDIGGPIPSFFSQPLLPLSVRIKHKLARIPTAWRGVLQRQQ